MNNDVSILGFASPSIPVVSFLRKFDLAMRQFLRPNKTGDRIKRTNKTNVNAILQPVLIYWHLTGNLPFSIRWTPRKGGGPEMELKFSKFWFAVSAGLLATTIAHTLWAPKMLFRLEKSVTAAATKSSRNQTSEKATLSFSSRQTVAVKIAHPLLVCLNSLTARGVGLSALLKILPEVGWKINRVDRVLSLPAGFYRANGFVLLMLLIGSLTLQIPIMGYHLWSLFRFHSAWGNAWEFFSIFNIFSTFSLEFQFATLCYAAKSRLGYVNEKLTAFFADEFGECDREIREFLTVSGENRPGFDIRRVDPNKPRNSAARHLDEIVGLHRKRMKLSDSIRSLRVGHVLLRDVMRDINRIYQFYLLISVFSSVTKILFNLYFSIFGFFAFSQKIPGKYQRAQVALVCLWSAYYLYRFLLIVFSADFSAAESNRTREIFVKIDRSNMDPGDRREIKMFWEHLSAGDFEFSACGLFNLNMALIASTFSAGISYIVIMAQFR